MMDSGQWVGLIPLSLAFFGAGVGVGVLSIPHLMTQRQKRKLIQNLDDLHSISDAINAKKNSLQKIYKSTTSPRLDMTKVGTSLSRHSSVNGRICKHSAPVVTWKNPNRSESDS